MVKELTAVAWRPCGRPIAPRYGRDKNERERSSSHVRFGSIPKPHDCVAFYVRFSVTSPVNGYLEGVSCSFGALQRHIPRGPESAQRWRARAGEAARVWVAVLIDRHMLFYFVV